MPPPTSLSQEQRAILSVLADAEIALCSRCIARAAQTSHNATEHALRALRKRELVDRSGNAYMARAAARDVLAA